MKFILGIVVGAFLTVGVAYVHDSALSGAAPDREARTLVNWTAFDAQMHVLNEGVSAGWSRLMEAMPRKG